MIRYDIGRREPKGPLKNIDEVSDYPEYFPQKQLYDPNDAIRAYGGKKPAGEEGDVRGIQLDRWHSRDDDAPRPPPAGGGIGMLLVADPRRMMR